MSVPGVIRFRKWQVGAQSVFGTPVVATHVLPYSGVMVANPNWTDDTADVGSIDEIIAPYRVGIDATASITGNTNYNDLPYTWNGLLKGGGPNNTYGKHQVMLRVPPTTGCRAWMGSWSR